MKLYFSPGACSLSPHIVLNELGIPFERERVDTKAGKTEKGSDYKAITAKGAVPALQLDNGQVLTEGAVIVQYLADQKPEAKLLPPAGSLERYRVQEWLNYVASDLHKGIGMFFNPKMGEEHKEMSRKAMAGRFAFVDAALAKGGYLMGSQLSVADPYLFTVLRWCKKLELDLSPFANIQAFMKRMAERPAVRKAMEAEGLPV